MSDIEYAVPTTCSATYINPLHRGVIHQCGEPADHKGPHRCYICSTLWANPPVGADLQSKENEALS